MTTEIEDYAHVRNRAAQLGCVLPENIVILPANFESAESRRDFLHLSEAATLRTLFRLSKIPINELLPKGEKAAYIHNNSFDWIAPILFISASLWSQNETAVTVALNVLSNYISDYLKGLGKKTVKLEVVVERNDDSVCKKLIYEGDVSGLTGLAPLIKGIASEKDKRRMD